MALAAERNPAEITTAAIAERMGLSQGAIFRHFPNKDAIIEATVGWVSERLLARLARAADGAATPLAALEAMFMAHVDFVARHPGVPRLLSGELQRYGATPAKRLVQSLLARYGERLQEILAAGRQAGELDPGLDPEVAAAAFLGSIQGLAVQGLIAGSPARMRRDAPGVFAIFRRGIEVRA